MKDVKEIYQKQISEFYSVNFDEFKKFLDFCGSGNISALKVYNQIIVFSQNNNAKIIYDYKKWREKGRIPKKNTGIFVMKSETQGLYVFDYKDTFAINETGQNYMYSSPNLKSNLDISTIKKEDSDFFDNNVIDDESYQSLIKRYDNEVLRDFIIECSNYIRCKRISISYEFDEKHMSELYNILKKEPSVLFSSIMPFVNKTVSNTYSLKKEEIKEKDKENVESQANTLFQKNYSDISGRYYLCLNENGRCLVSETEYKPEHNIIVLGKFENYKECCEACYLWDGLNEDAKEVSKDIFDSVYHEYHEGKTNSFYIYKISQDIIKKIKNTKELSDEDCSILFLSYQIKTIKRDYQLEYLKEVLESDIPMNKKVEFVQNIFSSELERNSEWEIGTGHNKDGKYVIKVYPYGLTEYTNSHEERIISVSYDKVTEILQSIVNDPAFKVPDLNGKMIDYNMNGNKFIAAYEKFIKENHLEKKYTLDRPYKIFEKDIDELNEKAKETYDENQLTNLIVNSLNWDKKTRVMDVMNNDRLSYEEIIKDIRYIYIHEIDNKILQVRRNYEGPVGIHADEKAFYAVWHDPKKGFIKIPTVWEKVENIINNKIENKEYLTNADIEKMNDYEKECIENLHSKEKEGLLPDYALILDDIYQHGRRISNREGAILTFMRIIADKNHMRDRKYLKEAFSQNMPTDKKEEFIKTYIDKYMFKFWGSYECRIYGVTDKGVTIDPCCNLFESDYDVKFSTGYLKKYTLEFSMIIGIIEKFIKQETFKLPENKLVGCQGNHPEGFIDFYNDFKNKYFNKCILYDTSMDTDSGFKKNENEQMDIFNYMNRHKKKR